MQRSCDVGTTTLKKTQTGTRSMRTTLLWVRVKEDWVDKDKAAVG